jgi:solute carrier family 12 sodium/potassium/chloride transporter 2
MFGAILFIRLPWIVGEVGILQATVIVALSVISVILTVMSLNAIVTNGKMVKSGSLYQVLRKNVGVEIGGGIGLIYIIGKIIATSMYALGAAECFLVAIDAYDSFQWSNQIVSLILCFIVAFAVLLGYSKLFFERNGMIFLAISVIGILSFIVGGIAFASHAFYGDLTSGSRIDVDNIAAVNKKDHTNIIPDFYFMLGLYFPSVSGVMGASTTFSGDKYIRCLFIVLILLLFIGSLKNPGRSIPRGTLGAVFLTLATSLIIIYLFGYTVSNDELLENKLVLASLSWPISGLGYVAFTAALVGAASQNFQGIVRNIDAIVADRSVPILQQFDPSNGPKATFKLVIFAWLLVSIPCLSHDLNFLAPIVAILFLIVYATINGACFLLSITKSPGFRPHFKYFR